MEEESWRRRNHGEGIVKDRSWRRDQWGGSLGRTHGGIIFTISTAMAQKLRSSCRRDSSDRRWALTLDRQNPYSGYLFGEKQYIYIYIYISDDNCNLWNDLL